MAKMAEQNCQTSIEKACWHLIRSMNWSLPVSNLWHPTPSEASSRSPGCNHWYPAVRTGVSTLGGNCWHGIGRIRIYSYTDRQPMARKHKYF